jgi:O-antigen polysaccharide polymerase Wzy
MIDGSSSHSETSARIKPGWRRRCNDVDERTISNLDQFRSLWPKQRGSSKIQYRPGTKIVRAFYLAFLFACLLFWWLPSLLFFLAGIDDPVKSWALWMSVAGIIAFTVGYLLPPVCLRTEIPQTVLDDCENLAWHTTFWLAIPALILAVQFFLYRGTVEYGEGEGLSLVHQGVLYTHMFAGFLYLGCARDKWENRRRIVGTVILVTLPRLIISLHWARFFLAQAVVPILFIALARGWIHMSIKRWVQLGIIALTILFVPALTRGDQFLAQSELLGFFASGSSLQLLQDNANLDLAKWCPPLFVSLTDKVIPYNLLGACTVDLWGQKGLPATLDRILTYNDPAADGNLRGTGSNYLLELYLSGGVTALLVGSVLFGYSNRCFIDWTGRRSLFAGIWAECLSRSLFAPRTTVGYVFERIPSLVFVTLFIALVLFIARATSGTAQAIRSVNTTQKGANT